MLIDRTPEPELFSSASHDDFIQIPNIARAGLPPPQVAGDWRAELGDPTTDRLIGNIDPTLKKHFFDFAQAQIEPQVKPNCVRDDLQWKTVTLEADVCIAEIYAQSVRHTTASQLT